MPPRKSKGEGLDSTIWAPSTSLNRDFYDQIRGCCARYPLNSKNSSKLLREGLFPGQLLEKIQNTPTLEGEDILIVVFPDQDSCGGGPQLAFMKDTGRLATSRLSKQGNSNVKGGETFLINLLGQPIYTPRYTYDDQDETHLRFQKLDRVRYNNGGTVHQWPLGTIKQLWWRQQGWLPGVAAYQFVDDWDGDLKYAPLDDNSYVRKAGNGEKARAQSTGTRSIRLKFGGSAALVFQNWGRKCLHPRCTDWRAGELTIPDNVVVQAAGMWGNSDDGNNPRAMPAPGVHQWTSSARNDQCQILKDIAEIAFVIMETYMKTRITRKQINILVPELFSVEGREKICGKGSVKRLVALLDSAIECELCIEKKCAENGILKQLHKERLLVDARCPCPRRHARNEFFCVDAEGYQYCSETNELLYSTKFEGLWGTVRRCAIGEALFVLGVMARRGSLIGGPNDPQYRVDLESIRGIQLNKMPPPDSTNSIVTTTVIEGGEKDSKICRICKRSQGGKDGIKLSRCSKCLQVWYCSRDHQIQDWPCHKKSCKKATQ